MPHVASWCWLYCLSLCSGANIIGWQRWSCPAVRLAWQIGGDLALANREPSLEPKHILYGICSVEKVIASKDGSRFRNSQEVALIRAESDRLSEIAQEYALNLSSVRRAIRESSASKMDQSAAGPLAGRVVSRSPAARRVFELAAEMSAAIGATAVDLLLLLRAVLETGDPQAARATTGFENALAGILKQLQGLDSRQARLFTTFSPEVADLDKQPEVAHRPVEIKKSLDADVSMVAKSAPSNAAADTIERICMGVRNSG